MKIIGYGLIGIVGFCVLAVMAGMDGALDEAKQSTPTLVQIDEIVVSAERDIMADQTQGVKNCVETLGQGVYSHRSTEWKIKTCNGKVNQGLTSA